MKVFWVGSLNQAPKRIRSGRKDNFWVKLEGKGGAGIPQSDPKSQSGRMKPITSYFFTYQNFEPYDDLKGAP